VSKKKQKTFHPLERTAPPPLGGRKANESFLVLFFKKEPFLAFFATPA
jgi:hypothetical protein